MVQPILSAKKIKKSFSYPNKIDILKEISMDLYPGQSIAIMGASGEGKTTLLHILGTLEKPTKGELFIQGKSSIKNPSPILRNKHIGFVFQGFNLLEDYTAIGNVLMPALIAGESITKGSPIYRRAEKLLSLVGLEKRMKYTSKLLSGGEKQRVAIARALCMNPEILLADEPSGNLDEQTSKKIHELLFYSTKELGKGLIVVTHDKELASLCDQIFYLKNGYLQQNIS
ncbi:MAG: ABC transporter ATP-binding protein [Chlamydiia bacterium]|nr:ABC transporter ATP-binding protein [Chlamydiia bacterium]